MGKINDVLGAAGDGVAVEVEGEKWHFYPLTKGAQASFEAWLEERVWQKLRAAKKNLDADDYARLVEHLHERICRGDFGLNSDAYDRAMKSGDGLLFFMQLLLRPRRPGVTREECLALLEKNPEVVEEALERLYPTKKNETETTPPDLSATP
jgi:hypothetical protein